MSLSSFLCTVFLGFLLRTSLATPSLGGSSDVGDPAGDGFNDGGRQVPEFLPVGTVKLSSKVKPRSFSCFFQDSHPGEEFDLIFLAEPWVKDKRNRGKPKLGDYLFSVVERAEDSQIISKLAAKEERSYKAKFRLKSFLEDQPTDDAHQAVNSSEYQMCLDTRRVSSDTVFTVALTKFQPVKAIPMEMAEATMDPVPSDLEFDLEDGGQITVKPTELTERMKFSMDKLSQNLRQGHYTLYERRQIEHFSRIQAETNYDLINRWSFIQVLTMVLASFIQILTIKSLFEERSFFRRFLIFSNERYY